MAQLVERSIQTPGICSSNPAIVKFYKHFQLFWKDENEEKESLWKA